MNHPVSLDNLLGYHAHDTVCHNSVIWRIGYDRRCHTVVLGSDLILPVEIRANYCDAQKKRNGDDLRRARDTLFTARSKKGKPRIPDPDGVI